MKKDKYNNFDIYLDDAELETVVNEISREFPDYQLREFLADAYYFIVEVEKGINGRFGASVKDLLFYVAFRYVSFVNNTSYANQAFIEIGTLFGGSAILSSFVIKYFQKQDHNNIPSNIMIDPLDGYYGDNLDPISGLPVTQSVLESNLYKFDVENYRIVNKFSTDLSVIKDISGQVITSLYIDGDHSYKGIFLDWYNYVKLVPVGGFILIDNYNDSAWPSVTIFMDNIAANFSNTFIVLSKFSHSILLKRISDKLFGSPQHVDLDVVSKVESEIERKCNLRIETRNVKLEKLEAMVSYRQNEIERLNTQISNRNEEISRFEELVDNRHEDISRLQGMVEYRDKELARLQEMVNYRDKEMVRLQEMVDYRDKEMVRLQKMVDYRNQNVSRLEEQVQNRNMRIEKFETMVGYRNSEIDRLSTLVANRDKKIDTLNSITQNQKKQILHLEEKNTSLKESVIKSEELFTSLKSNVLKLVDLIASHRKINIFMNPFNKKSEYIKILEQAHRVRENTNAE